MKLRRVGHKGADHIAPGNTTASFDAALAAAVDMIEFDVLPEDPEDRERLAADPRARLRSTSRPTRSRSRRGSRTSPSPQFADVELDVDLKLPGYEARVVEALRRHGLVERTLVSTLSTCAASSCCASWSRGCGSAGRSRACGATTPRRRSPPCPAWALLLRMRRRLPAVAAAHVRAGRCDALMAHWRLVTPRLVRMLREAGGDLYVWTVDDAARIRGLEALGVTGVITNDPRLFG